MGPVCQTRVGCVSAEQQPQGEGREKKRARRRLRVHKQRPYVDGVRRPKIKMMNDGNVHYQGCLNKLGKFLSGAYSANVTCARQVTLRFFSLSLNSPGMRKVHLRLLLPYLLSKNYVLERRKFWKSAPCDVTEGAETVFVFFNIQPY